MQFQLGSGIPSRNPTEEERDRARAVGVRQGDRSAFEALYRFYYEPLCDYVEYNIGDGNEAEDIVQNIFLRIWMKKEMWYPEISVRSYLYGAARFEIINTWRNRSVKRSTIEPIPYDSISAHQTPISEANPERDHEIHELRKATNMCISLMPERQRMVFQLARWHGLHMPRSRQSWKSPRRPSNTKWAMR